MRLNMFYKFDMCYNMFYGKLMFVLGRREGGVRGERHRERERERERRADRVWRRIAKGPCGGSWRGSCIHINVLIKCALKTSHDMIRHDATWHVIALA